MTISRFGFTDEEARVYDEQGTLKASASSQALCNLLYGGRVRDVGLLPPAIRWLASNGSGVAVERQPGEYPFEIDGEVRVLYLPWTLWLILFDSPNLAKITSMYVFAQNYSLASEMDDLGVLPLPGVMPDGSIHVPKVALPKRPILGQVINMIVDRYIETPRRSEEFYAEQSVPAGWPTTGKEVVDHLANTAHLDITFAPYEPIMTLGQLLEKLEPSDANTAEEDVLEFLGRMVDIAGKG